MTNDASYDEYFEELLRSQRPDTHPLPEDLIQYHENRLAPDAVEALQDHLAICPECARAVLDLGAFPDFEPGSDFAVDPEAEQAAWEFVRSRLAVEPLNRPESVATAAESTWPWRAIAAVLLLTVVLQTLWILQLKHQSSAGNALVVDLYDRSAVRRTVEADDATPVPQDVNMLVWILNPSSLPSYPGYLLEIRATSGREETVWTGSVAPQEGGYFTLSIPPAMMPAGRYVFLLFGLGESGREKLAEFERVVLHE